MTNILITGSSGFIGSHILNKLYKKNKIYLILRKKNKHRNKLPLHQNIKIIYYDGFDNLNKKLKNINANIVIHCATHYIKNHAFEDIDKFVKSNMLFGNILIENLRSMKTKKFINFSTVWEDHNSIKDNNLNLYSVYKKGFSILIDYYKKLLNKINFYNLMVSDTFGHNDKRLKIINVLRKNYNKKKTTKIISRNLSVNLLNVNDIFNAVDTIIKKNIKPGRYLLKNKNSYKIGDIIKAFNAINSPNIKVEWLSKKIIKEKIYPYTPLSGWHAKQSGIKDIIDTIKT